MKNFKNYICLFLMILGINVNVKADISGAYADPSEFIVTSAEGTVYLDIKNNSAGGWDQYYNYYYTYYAQVISDDLIDYGGEDIDDWFFTPTYEHDYVGNSIEQFPLYYYFEEQGDYTATIRLYYWDGAGEIADQPHKDINITIHYTGTTYNFIVGDDNIFSCGEVIDGCNSSNHSLTVGSLTELPIAIPCDVESNVGWVFDGWSETHVSKGSTTYTKVTLPYSGSATEFYAVYKLTHGDKSIYASSIVCEKHTLTYDANGGQNAPVDENEYAFGETVTILGAGSMTYAQHIFLGWSTTFTATEAQFLPGQETSMGTTNATLYAIWKEANLTNYQTYCPRTVSFDLNGLQGEAPAPILTKKNLTIIAPSDPVTPEGITFLGWYNGDTKWNFETDVVTEDMQLSAKCQSALVISGNVHLTSGKDVQVYTTPATNNMITVSWFGKDEPLATKIRFSYYLNGQKVTDPTNSPFRVCYADNYNMVSSNINNEGDNFEQTFAVSYKPTAYNQLDNYTIRVEAVNDAGTQAYRSADLVVYGRSLPEQFVIAIKKDNQWYAVPNVLATSANATAEEQPAALEIDVDDSNNPTYAKTSDNATAALYKSAVRQTAGEHRGAIRLQSVVNNNYITATTSNNTYFYMKSSNDQNQQFYLTSADCNKYKVTLDPAEYKDNDNTPTRWMSIYGSKIGWYNTTACNVYFLPVITELIEVADEQTRNLSNYGVNENTTVIVHAGGTLNADKVATIGTLQIEKTGNKSGQVFETATLTANNAYFDLTINAQGMKWYDIAVPFTVDRLNGLSFPNGGTFPLNDVLVYNGATRATNGTNGSAWQYQDDGDLVPGVGYDIMFATDVTTVRFTKKAGAQLNNEEEQLAVSEFASQTGLDMDANWNYIANNTLHYVNLGFDETQNSGVLAQTYNPSTDSYTAYAQDGATYLVGTPFFVQVAKEDKIAWGASPIHDILRAPAMTTNRVERFTIELSANGEMNDRLFVSADEDARNEYQIGKDVAKMGVSSTIAQMWVENYNTKLCANEAVLFNDQASFPLGIFVPKNGEYTLAITSAPDNAELYLTQDGQPIWNLSKGAYTTEWAKGTHNEYGLMLQVTDAKAPTNLNGLNGSDKAVKFLKNSDIYILRNAKLYNAQGQLVK